MAAKACVRTALIVALALAGIRAEQLAARLRFQRSFPLDDLGKDKAVEARKQFESDIVDELSGLLGVKGRLRVHSVNVQDRVVKISIQDSAYGTRPEALVEVLNRHRTDHESPLWTNRLTSHVDETYPIKLVAVEPADLSRWVKRSSVVYIQPTTAAFADEGREDDDVNKKYRIGQDWSIDLFDFVARQVGYSIAMLWSQFVEAFGEFSLYAQIGTVVGIVFLLVTLGGTCFQFFREVVEVQEDGIVVKPHSGRKGPGRGSPYKEEIKYYTPQSSEKKSLRQRYAFARDGTPPRHLHFGDL